MDTANKELDHPEIINRLKEIRSVKQLSQGELAERAGITRQAVSSIESNLYLPTTAVALRLAHALSSRVEDLFSLSPDDQAIVGRLAEPISFSGSALSRPLRVKVSRVADRMIVRPAGLLGDVLPYTIAADGFLAEPSAGVGSLRAGSRVKVRLSRDRRAIEHEISVAGCDPAIFLAGEYLRRRKDPATVVGWSMGSMAALRALERGEVHVAGVHLIDPATRECNLPILKQRLKAGAYDVVTFATWEEGLLVAAGNPKSIHSVADLARSDVRIINREEGAGARLLLDQRLRSEGIDPGRLNGYARTASSHFQVARSISEGQADAGVGIRSVADLFGLDFAPLQEARYDLVVPKAYLKKHPSLAHLFDTLTVRAFRTEIEALGGYDTSETGKVREL